MTRRLYLMRHGQTMFNEAYKAQGWVDSPLTEKGIEQARRAGRILRERELEFDHFASSTSERASDTLELVMQELYGEIRPYERTKQIKESGYGTYEAVTLNIFGPLVSADQDALVMWGAEPYATVIDRMQRWLTDYMLRDGIKNALVVSHMRASMAFGEYVTGSPDALEGKLTNCAVIVYDFDVDTRTFTLAGDIQTGGDPYGIGTGRIC